MKAATYNMGVSNINYFKWRPILEGVATLSEIDEKYNLCDLADANEALDIKVDAEAWYQKQALNKSKKK